MQRALHMGGKPFADYSGLLCLAGHEHAAFRAFADHIVRRMAWDRFRILHLRDQRADLWFSMFQRKGLQFIRCQAAPCPLVRLPGSWDAYLDRFVSTGNRVHLRRRMRQIERLDGFRTTVADEASLVVHTEALLALFQQRWGARSKEELRDYHAVFRSALSDGRLWLRVIWIGDEAIAGIAVFIDRVRRQFCYYMSAFNQAYARYSPGKVIIAFALRDAIDHGCQTFDMCVGGELYKYETFGAEPHVTATATVLRTGFLNRFHRLSVRLLSQRPGLLRPR
jgi:CelD/BcsL family acetyltransferase involved in cellulose biosynthesis